MKVDAVVLAGAPNNGQLKESSSAKWEATIPIHNKPMVNYVIEALLNSSRIEKIVVVGPEEIRNTLTATHITFVESGKSLPANIFRAMDVLDQTNKVLLV